MCAQLRKNSLGSLPPSVSPGVTALGLPASETQIALQQDVVKELVNKIAWTLGSVYRHNYSTMRTPARAYAWRLVKQILEDHGYPDKISIK